MTRCLNRQQFPDLLILNNFIDQILLELMKPNLRSESNLNLFFLLGRNNNFTNWIHRDGKLLHHFDLALAVEGYFDSASALVDETDLPGHIAAHPLNAEIYRLVLRLLKFQLHGHSFARNLNVNCMQVIDVQSDDLAVFDVISGGEDYGHGYYILGFALN